MSGGRRAGSELRRELPLLLAGSLAVFTILAGFTLLAYRSAVADLVAERQAEALRVALRLAEEGLRPGGGTIDALARLCPPGGAVALLDSSGRELASHGFDGPADLASDGLAPPRESEPQTVGPEGVARGTVVALVPLAPRPDPRILRFDLPAATLASQSRRLAVLAPVVVGLSLAAALLLLAVARALVRPYEKLLERARSAAGPDQQELGETELLLSTFDRALKSLAPAPGADLAALHESLAPQVASGLILVDAGGELLAANDVACDLLGLAPPLVGEPIERVLSAHPALVELLRSALVTGHSAPRAEARAHSGERELALGVVVEVLHRTDGTLRGLLVLLADLTASERRAARDRLAESLAQLGELAAGVAHELRNGLATLSGYLDLARRRPLDELAAEHLAEAKEESIQLRRVVEDFLLFARPGSRRLEPIDLGAMLRRACGDPALGDVAVDLELAEERPPLLGDGTLLERAVKNLLGNAAESLRSVGRRDPIEVRLARSADGYLLTVADRGAGLPAGDPERLFEPFVSHRPGGAGLGLAIARRIVLLHGGAIRLAARAGGGAEARIDLPAGTSVTESSDA